jgi:hypothetical protein
MLTVAALRRLALAVAAFSCSTSRAALIAAAFPSLSGRVDNWL